MSGWLWLLPPISALVFWGAAEMMEDHFPCSDIVPEMIAAALGAFVGFVAANAIRERCRKVAKDREAATSKRG